MFRPVARVQAHHKIAQFLFIPFDLNSEAILRLDDPKFLYDLFHLFILHRFDPFL